MPSSVVTSRPMTNPAKEPSLYIVPASSRMARSRVRAAVIDGLDQVRVSKGSADDLAFISHATGESGRAHVWGIRESKHLRGPWARASAGDWFLFYARGFLFAAARVSSTHESTGLASRIWSDGVSFPLLIGFDEIVLLDVKAYDYRTVLGARFLGFREINKDWRATIGRRFGSVDEFILGELRDRTGDRVRTED
jgi:hypothetical protein